MHHDDGQYRAELFEEFIHRLLLQRYPLPVHHIVRNATVTSPADALDSISIDFIVDAADGEVVVETKAPYNDTADVLVRTLDRVVSAVNRLSLMAPVRQAIIAVPLQLPDHLLRYIERATVTLKHSGTTLEVWDAAKLSESAKLLLNASIETFSVVELESIVGSRREPIGAQALNGSRKDQLPIGERMDVVVLSADFCSFSRFVHASGADTSLIASVMGRFYREARDAVATNGGVLDKFIGDGILCYWFDANCADALEKCVSQLAGIAINLAEEWQDQIDIAVSPKGLTAGAAIGSVLFIEERPGQIHAIGESINLSARLQSKAKANTLVIANRLHTRLFGNKDYTSLGSIDCKNIGPVVAWERSVGVARDTKVN